MLSSPQHQHHRSIESLGSTSWPEEDFESVVEASYPVIAEAKAAGVYVLGAGSMRP